MRTQDLKTEVDLDQDLTLLKSFRVKSMITSFQNCDLNIAELILNFFVSKGARLTTSGLHNLFFIDALIVFKMPH